MLILFCNILSGFTKNFLDFSYVFVKDHFQFDVIHVDLIVDEIKLFYNFLDLLFGIDLLRRFLPLSMSFTGVGNFAITQELIILLVIFALFMVVFLLDETNFFGHLFEFTETGLASDQFEGLVSEVF